MYHAHNHTFRTPLSCVGGHITVTLKITPLLNTVASI